MEINQKTSQDELREEGWKLISFFSSYQIWSKENKRLLFDAFQKKVHHIYQVKGGKLEIAS